MATLGEIIAKAQVASASSPVTTLPPDVTAINNFSLSVVNFVDKWAGRSGQVDILRCSGLHYVCPRAFVINYWRPAAPVATFDAVGYLRMNCGTSIHKFMQDVVLGPGLILKGSWHNTSDGSIVGGYHPDPERAIFEWEHSNMTTWEYIEPEYFDPHYRISGHSDGVVSIERLKVFNTLCKNKTVGLKAMLKELEKISGGEDALLEMKSTSAGGFTQVNGPTRLPGVYTLQAAMYQHMSGLSSTVFLYISRDNCAMNSFKFVATPSMVTYGLDKAAVIWESIRDRTLPVEYMPCMSLSDTAAKNCNVSDACFAHFRSGSNYGDFHQFIEESKLAQPDRKWLDLSGWSRSH